jgi:hypothetical protein
MKIANIDGLIPSGDQASPISSRLDGRDCGAVALQWYLRCPSEEWTDRCGLATSLALFGMRQSKMQGREVDEWKAGFREGLGNLPGAKGVFESS